MMRDAWVVKFVSCTEIARQLEFLFAAGLQRGRGRVGGVPHAQRGAQPAQVGGRNGSGDKRLLNFHSVHSMAHKLLRWVRDRAVVWGVCVGGVCSTPCIVRHTSPLLLPNFQAAVLQQSGSNGLRAAAGWHLYSLPNCSCCPSLPRYTTFPFPSMQHSRGGGHGAAAGWQAAGEAG